MSARRGFTVVEVVVAIVVLSIGILGLATTAALVTRMIGQGTRFTEASTLAQERFEMLRPLPCDSLRAGTATPSPYAVAWTVDSIGGRPPGRLVRVLVKAPTAAGGARVRTDTFTTTFTCET